MTSSSARGIELGGAIFTGGINKPLLPVLLPQNEKLRGREKRRRDTTSSERVASFRRQNSRSLGKICEARKWRHGIQLFFHAPGGSYRFKGDLTGDSSSQIRQSSLSVTS